MSVLENFKNIPRSPSHRATGPKCNFFFFKFAMRSLKKKDMSPVGGATRPPFFSQGLRCKFGEKNYTLGLSPYGRANGVYF